MPRMGRGGRGARISPFDMALLSRPQSSTTRTVFPYDRLLRTYSKLEFNAHATQGRISEQELDVFLQSIHNDPKFKLPCPWILFLLPVVMIAAVIVVVVSITSSVKNRDPGQGPNFLPFIALPIAFVIMIVIACFAQKQANQAVHDRAVMVTQKCNEMNQQISSKEIRWTVGSYAAYIILELDFVAKMMGGIGMNPMMGGMGMNPMMGGMGMNPMMGGMAGQFNPNMPAGNPVF